ncbi:MAG: hypothetical protein MJ171_00040 [Clostridia bacterium]|nr:hypothetical protein [Clostridia bacterium]
MRYLPILEELFESNTIILLIIGVIIAFIAVSKKTNYKLLRNFTLYAIGAYLVCEVIENVQNSYMIEIIVLFIGTLLLGACVGLLLKLILVKLIK